MLVEGQMEGSAYMGFAEAVMEQHVFKETGFHSPPRVWKALQMRAEREKAGELSPWKRKSRQVALPAAGDQQPNRPTPH